MLRSLFHLTSISFQILKTGKLASEKSLADTLTREEEDKPWL